MKKRITDIITIDNSLATPVYKQIVQSIHRCIEKGVLTQNDMLPSVNSISETFSMARGSVFTAYNDLRASGIIDSIPGKGYFITSTRINQKKKILLLLADPSKMPLYNTIFNNLPEGCIMNVYFHHNNIGLFENIVSEQGDRYNTFIIVPPDHKDTLSILSQLENRQLFLLDSGIKEYRKSFNGVFTNEEKIMHDILANFKERIRRYKTLFLIASDLSAAKDFVSGFNKFTKKFSINSAVIDNRELEKIKKKDGVIVLADEDLVEIVQYANSAGYKTGSDIGIISYSEHILKAVIGSGITTAQPDFPAMGQIITSMIFSEDKGTIDVPVVITDRSSF